MAAASSGQQQSYSRQDVEFLYHHVFLPPKLPQSGDYSPGRDLALLRATQEALTTLENLVPSQYHASIEAANAMLTTMQNVHCNGPIREYPLLQAFGELIEKRAPLALHIRAQNAGVLLCHVHDDINIDVFELSPTNEAAMSTIGRLQRSFPAASVAIKTSDFQEAEFQHVLAQTISSMSSIAVASMQPKVRKTGKLHIEDRDTACPSMVTESLVGFLLSVGRPAALSGVIKNTREEVRWLNARSPWRRSPKWLLTRVALQLIFARGEASSVPYKETLLVLMSRIEQLALEQKFGSDDLYVMNAKIAQRTLKLGSSIDTKITQHVQEITSRTHKLIENRWKAINARDSPTLDLERLSKLDFEADTFVTLPNLDEYLASLQRRTPKGTKAKGIQSHSLIQFAADKLPCLSDAHLFINETYAVANLRAFEDWVSTHCQTWARRRSFDSLPDTTEALAALVKRYHKLALQHYAENPEALSVMLLTLFELWIACDQGTTSVIPLLKEYETGINCDILQNLLLPEKHQMDRLSLVEAYLRDRRTHSKHPYTKLFGTLSAPDCFPARYFDHSTDQQESLQAIVDEAELAKKSKLKEFEEKKEKYNGLMAKYDRSKCEYDEVIVDKINNFRDQVHKSNCTTCRYRAEALDLQIPVYEWPLPSNGIKAKSVVFELRVPDIFACWREATLYMIKDTLDADCGTRSPRARYQLSSNAQLKPFSKPIDTFRCRLLSADKPHVGTHRNFKMLSTATESEVCLPSGLNYQYFDDHTGEFLGQFIYREETAMRYTYTLPPRSGALQKYLYRPASAKDGPSPNLVIASQADCPSNMTLEEFKDLAIVALGHRIQWHNILLQLRAQTIDFKKDETAMFVFQCIYQAGPAGASGSALRSAHELLADDSFTDTMLDSLTEALRSTKENWDSAQAIAVYAAIIGRVLSLSSHELIQQRCIHALKEIRNTVFRWVEVLRARTHAAESHDTRTELLSKTVDVALICGSSYNVDDGYLKDMFGSTRNVSILVQCSMVVQEGTRVYSKSTDPILHLLHHGFRQLLGRACGMICSSPAGLDDAVRKTWPAYRAGEGWTALKGHENHWVHTKTHISENSASLNVHYNALTGELLVQGLPLARAPEEFEKHPHWQVLFGKAAIEVMPTTYPGMQFSLKQSYKDHEIHVGIEKSGDHTDLTVLSIKDGSTYTSIPSRLFDGRYPTFFVEGFVHWYNHTTKTVEFRPRQEPWARSTSEMWSLSKGHQTEWQLNSEESALIRLQCTTSKTLETILRPLADISQTHISLSPSRSSVTVDIPRIQIGFFLSPGQSSLQSREFRGMCIDEDQSLNTMTGFTNKLLLKPAELGQRMVLLAEGPISHVPSRDHVGVSINSGCIAKVHSLHIDTLLGRLVDNGDLQCKFLQARLHSLTSHCLPDGLTGRTGTEQCLSILRSAAVGSFDQLTAKNLNLLEVIASVTPGRAYYPSNERVMQSADFDSKLSFLSQHNGIAEAVAEVLAQAEESSIFHAQSTPLFNPLEDIDTDLLARDKIRSSTYSTSAFGAEDFKRTKDHVYEARDSNQHSGATLNAQRLSAMVHLNKTSKHWKHDIKSLWNASKAATIKGSTNSSTPLPFKFDPQLIEGGFNFANWLLIHKILQSNQRPGKYSFMIWLSTLAAAERPQLPALQAIALMYTTPTVCDVAVPHIDRSRPIEGYTVQLSDVESIVQSHEFGFSRSPEASMRANPGEDRWQFETRRKKLFSKKQDRAVSTASERIYRLWPAAHVETPDYSDLSIKPADYIKMASVIESTNKLFRSRHDNLQVHSYFDKIEAAISQLSTQELISATWPFRAMSRPADCKRFVKLQDLLEHGGPILTPFHASLTNTTQANSTGVLSPRLSELIDKLEASCSSAFEAGYIAELRQSALSLGQGNSQVAYVETPTSNCLQDYHIKCSDHLDAVYGQIVSHFGKIANEIPGSAICKTIGQCPRISPSSVLQLLSRRHWPSLQQHHKAWLVDYGLTVTAAQRANRMLKASTSPNKDVLMSELANPGHENWSPHQYPESLLLEIESGITIRAVQEEIAAEMRTPSSSRNAVMQLNMGEGKSSTIVPMTAAALADSSQLVRVVVAKPQSKQMLQMLVSKLGGLIGRRVRLMPFSRALNFRKAQANAVRTFLKGCMDRGDIILIQPEHILSFRLMVLECSNSESTQGVGRPLLATQLLLDKYSRDIVDESDENFSTKFELIYTMGTQRGIEFSPNRWRCIQEVLELVRRMAPQVKQNIPDSIDLQDCAGREGRFPRLRILKSEGAELLVSLVAAHICEVGIDGLPIARQSRPVRDAVKRYFVEANLTDEELERIENDSPGALWQSASARSYMLLLRGLLAGGILTFVLSQKRWRVNYGLAPDRLPRTRLAVPYRAKDSPTPRSEFSHPDVVLTLTCLTYYYDGLEEADLFTAFEQLIRRDQADVEYDMWIKDSPSMPDAFHHLRGVNIKDRLQCVAEIFPHLRQSKSVIDFFLADIVFPKEVRAFPHKLSASGWDIGMVKSRPTTGFSGTNDSKTLLPLDVEHLDLPRQQHTNALVMMHILDPKNSVHLMRETENTRLSDAEQLLATVVQQDPPTQVILDVGAQILELDHRGVAGRWLELNRLHQKHDRKRAVVFVNDADDLSVLDFQGRVEPLQTSSYLSRLDECLVFLDEAHTRGIDLKLPKNYRAAVTLGANLTKDRLAQACMRMRQLGKGQTVVFCINGEIEGKIRTWTSKLQNEAINVADVLHWAIMETFTEIRRAMPLWAAQGERFLRQKELWDDIAASGVSQERAAKFLELESQTLEDRYRPRRSSQRTYQVPQSKIKRMDEVRDRCAKFDNLQYNASVLQEEQERELSPEIEQETQIELPASAQAAPHQLHPDVSRFVLTGQTNSASSAYIPAFQAFRKTTIATDSLISQLDGDKHLLVTADFAKTIRSGSAVSHTTDSYQRSVQWVLATRCNGNAAYLMIISPYEAEKLIAEVQASSNVALHLYKPRHNVNTRDFDRLDFLSIPAKVATQNIPRSLLLRLDIFAGQLYLNSYDDYLLVCTLLGLAAEVPQEGQVVAADGFILRDRNGIKTPGSSPVKFLDALMSQIRRNGQGIARTDLGYILEGKLLERSHFEGRGSGAA